MSNKRFLINKGGVYYLTTGKLLAYNPKKAQDDEQKKGVKFIEETFERIRNEPHTWYQAVQLRESDQAPVQTGE